jgi:spore coat protein B
MEQTGVSLAFLQSMVGRGVRVFKGGHESKTGILRSVNSDHLVLETENEGVIYYCLQHLKSVSENSKQHFNASNQEASDYLETETLNELLECLRGQMIQIDRKGPESRKGTLLDIKSDFIVLQTKEEGVLYSNIQHIKSISQVILNNENEEENAEGSSEAERSSEAEGNEEVSAVPDYIDAADFNGLLTNLKHSWVQINRGGAEKIEGVLADIGDDHVILINGQDVNRIQTFHIRNISYPMQQNQNSNSSQENQNSDSQSSNQNQQQDSENFSKFMKYMKYKDYSTSKNEKKYNKYLKYKKYESKVSSKFEEQQTSQQ